MAWTLSWLDFVLFFLFILVVLYYFGTKNHNYFKNNGIKYIGALPFVGNVYRMVIGDVYLANLVQEAYKKFENEKYFGFFFFKYPIVVLKDLELIKRITVKDFDHFTDHFTVPNEEDPLFFNNLFSLQGEKWHQMRTTLSPAFTSSKMRAMLPFITDCSQRLIEFLKKESLSSRTNGKNYIEKEMKDMLSKVSNDVIASCAFGIDTDSSNDPNNEFYKTTKILTSIKLKDVVILFVSKMAPFLRKIFNFKITAEKVNEFYRYIVMDIIKSRTKSGMVRKDMIHLLMLAMKGSLSNEDGADTNSEDIGFATVEENLKAKKSVKINWTDDEITAQAVIFLFGGFDTISGMLSFMCYELACNPEAQDRLREEVDQYISDSGYNIKYDDIRNLTYMDMVVSETLRLWPPIGHVDRVCNKPLTLPPTASRSENLTIQKEDMVWVPVYSIQRDAKYYPNPDKFIPERFSDENKSSIDPLTFLPFGVGPRSCIGNRFALMQAKVVMFYLIANFEIIRTEKTDIPLHILGHVFTMIPKNGIWVGLKQRKT